MRSIQKKKGMSIGDMYPAVLTIVLVGMVLGVGLYVLSTFHDQVTTSYTGSDLLVNGTSGTSTLGDYALAEYDVSAITVINTTLGASVTNYTFTSAGVITWGTLAVTDFGLDTVNISSTYTYDATDTPEEAMTTTITGLATFADWIAIIVVVIAAAIVLGVVLSSFGRGKNNMI